MVDIMDFYKSLNVSIGAVMKNPEMLKFVPDKLKNCVSMQLKSYLFYKIGSGSV